MNQKYKDILTALRTPEMTLIVRMKSVDRINPKNFEYALEHPINQIRLKKLMCMNLTYHIAEFIAESSEDEGFVMTDYIEAITEGIKTFSMERSLDLLDEALVRYKEMHDARSRVPQPDSPTDSSSHKPS